MVKQMSGFIEIIWLFKNKNKNKTLTLQHINFGIY